MTNYNDNHDAVLMKQDDAMPSPLEYSQDVVEYCVKQLNNIITLMTFTGTVTIAEAKNNQLRLEIDNVSDANRLIGRGGATLLALQALLRTMVYQQFKERVSVFLDSDNYIQMRYDAIVDQAYQLAETLEKSNQVEYHFEPMVAPERYAIHHAFQDHPTLVTYSEGVAGERHIVLKKK